MQFIKYIATLNDLIEKKENSTQVLVMNFVHNVDAKVVPSRKLRLATFEDSIISMQYNNNFYRNNGLEYYIPKGADVFGSISYLEETELWNEINDNINNGYYSWETIFPWDILA